jgi:hypothetical protein
LNVLLIPPTITMPNTVDNRPQLAQLMLDFISETILGHERGLYRAGIPVSRNVILGAAMNYLNGCYKSLILKDDEYVVQKFKEMTDLVGHSEVCLINIIMQILQLTHMSLDRTKIDTTSVDTLETTVKAEVGRIITPFKEKLAEGLAHVCHGEKIEDCDPNEPLFYARTSPE